jgi:hypothetical protein
MAFLMGHTHTTTWLHESSFNPTLVMTIERREEQGVGDDRKGLA